MLVKVIPQNLNTHFAVAPWLPAGVDTMSVMSPDLSKTLFITYLTSLKEGKKKKREMHQTINQSINWSVNLSVSRSVSQPVSPPAKEFLPSLLHAHVLLWLGP